MVPGAAAPNAALALVGRPCPRCLTMVSERRRASGVPSRSAVRARSSSAAAVPLGQQALDERTLTWSQIQRPRRLLRRLNLAAGRQQLVGRHGVLVHVVAIQGLVDETRPGAGEDQAYPAVPVRARDDGLVEAADLDQAAAPHRGGAEDEVVLEERPPLVGDLEDLVLLVAAPQGSTVDLEVRVGGDEVEVGAGGGELAHRLEPLGHVEVVGVEQGDELARGSERRRGLGRTLAAVLAPQQRDPVQVGLERALDVVGGAVVADDHLVRAAPFARARRRPRWPRSRPPGRRR